MNRTILHCDLNNFYASVECVKNPVLKNKAVAVCGNPDDRHGIVLAKSQSAKLCGVKTGDTISEASNKCKNLIVVLPDFDAYHDYSEIVKEIYSRYTDLIEPFGMDECWLDISESSKLFGNGEKIANEIRKIVKQETGLTISVGVSFNKVFAKLGSDMKKPDAVTVISKENFKDKIWCLPANELLFVGRKTNMALEQYGINTIGDIAKSNPTFLKRILGKNGFDLWLYANGMDTAPVSYINFTPALKSVSRGITCVESLVSIDEAKRVIAELSVKVSKGLRYEHLLAKGVQLAVRDDTLKVQQYGDLLDFPTHSAKDLFNEACCLLEENHNWNNNIRSLTVITYDLIVENTAQQLTVEYDIMRHIKTDSADTTATELRKRYGKNTLFNGCRLFGTKIPAVKSEHSSLPPAGYNG